MCKFCDNLDWRKYRVPHRNEDGCDNLCEVMTAKLENIDGEVFSTGSDCEDCNGCADMGFSMHTYDNRIGFGFSHSIKALHIGRYSEMLDINFCPWCGKRLSKEMVDFDKCCLGTPIDKEN